MPQGSGTAGLIHDTTETDRLALDIHESQDAEEQAATWPLGSSDLVVEFLDHLPPNVEGMEVPLDGVEVRTPRGLENLAVRDRRAILARWLGAVVSVPHGRTVPDLLFRGGRCGFRTHDLCRVKAALYR